MLTIWGRETAPNVRKVIWTCDELGLTYQRRDIGGPFGGTDSPEFRSLNPNGRIPVIEEDGFALWESNAIMRYLADRPAGRGLYPEGVQDRALIGQWMDWQQAHLAPSLKPLVDLTLRRDPALPPASAGEIAGAEAAITGLLEIVEARLEGRDFLMGDQLTLADMPIAVNVNMWRVVGRASADLPRLQRWYQHIQSQTAFQPLPARKPASPQAAQ